MPLRNDLDRGAFLARALSSTIWTSGMVASMGIAARASPNYSGGEESTPPLIRDGTAFQAMRNEPETSDLFNSSLNEGARVRELPGGQSPFRRLGREEQSSEKPALTGREKFVPHDQGILETRNLNNVQGFVSQGGINETKEVANTSEIHYAPPPSTEVIRASQTHAQLPNGYSLLEHIVSFSAGSTLSMLRSLFSKMEQVQSSSNNNAPTFGSISPPTASVSQIQRPGRRVTSRVSFPPSSMDEIGSHLGLEELSLRQGDQQGFEIATADTTSASSHATRELSPLEPFHGASHQPVFFSVPHLLHDRLYPLFSQYSPRSATAGEFPEEKYSYPWVISLILGALPFNRGTTKDLAFENPSFARTSSGASSMGPVTTIRDSTKKGAPSQMPEGASNSPLGFSQNLPSYTDNLASFHSRLINSGLARIGFTQYAGSRSGTIVRDLTKGGATPQTAGGGSNVPFELSPDLGFHPDNLSNFQTRLIDSGLARIGFPGYAQGRSDYNEVLNPAPLTAGSVNPIISSASLYKRSLVRSLATLWSPRVVLQPEPQLDQGQTAEKERQSNLTFAPNPPTRNSQASLEASPRIESNQLGTAFFPVPPSRVRELPPKIETTAESGENQRHEEQKGLTIGDSGAISHRYLPLPLQIPNALLENLVPLSSLIRSRLVRTNSSLGINRYSRFNAEKMAVVKESSRAAPASSSSASLSIRGIQLEQKVIEDQSFGNSAQGMDFVSPEGHTPNFSHEVVNGGGTSETSQDFEFFMSRAMFSRALGFALDFARLYTGINRKETPQITHSSRIEINSNAPQQIVHPLRTGGKSGRSGSVIPSEHREAVGDTPYSSTQPHEAPTTNQDGIFPQHTQSLPLNTFTEALKIAVATSRMTNLKQPYQIPGPGVGSPYSAGNRAPVARHRLNHQVAPRLEAEAVAQAESSQSVFETEQEQGSRRVGGAQTEMRRTIQELTAEENHGQGIQRERSRGEEDDEERELLKLRRQIEKILIEELRRHGFQV